MGTGHNLVFCLGRRGSFGERGPELSLAAKQDLHLGSGTSTVAQSSHDWP